jgi:nucleoside phosphorylase/CheY-like chemotaxis protein
MAGIKILLVEDDERKAKVISNVLCDVPSITAADITLAHSVIEAKQAMIADYFDLLLLDIQLPMRKGERPETDGGLKLWQTIRSRANYKRPEHVIGLTAYEETRRELSGALEEENWLLVQYDDSTTGWRDQVLQKVEHILTVRAQAAIADSSYLTPAVIITAVDVERDAIRKLPYAWEAERSERHGALVFRGEFPKKDGNKGTIALVTAQQMGMPAAACLTLSVIEELRPRYVIMAGIAAGVRDKVNLGDVIVADPSWDWGSGKLALDKGNRIFQPDPRPLRVCYELVAICQQIAADEALLTQIRNHWQGAKPDTILRVHVGPMASGSSVIADASVVEEIAAHARKLIGIDLETYAVYYAGRACPSPKPEVISIKSVCDFADDDKDDMYQSYAAYTSSAIVQVLLEQQLSF